MAVDTAGDGAGRARCPECGALTEDGLDCWERLGRIGAWEWDDPALMAEHFLTVACYNLQHPARFTDEAIAGLRDLFIAHLDEGLAVSEIRRRVARQAEGATRVLRPRREVRPLLRRWSMTIADVYQGGQPAGAAERVRAWAVAVRRDLAEPDPQAAEAGGDRRRRRLNPPRERSL